MAWTTPATATAGSTALTAAFWNTQVRDNTNELYGSIRRLGFQTRTTDYTINTTSVASAADVFSSDISFTADGTSTYWVEGQVQGYTGYNVGEMIDVYLVNGSGTALNRVWFLAYNQVVNQRLTGSGRFSIPYAPSAGTVTLNLRAIYNSAGGGAVLQASAAGAGTTFPPMWLAVYGPNLT
jgi:hypothetical protein